MGREESVGSFWLIIKCLWVVCVGFPGGASGKELQANTGDKRDVGSIPGSGQSPGGGNGNPLQYSCLENSKDRRDCWATVHLVPKNHQTQLKWLSRVVCEWV